MDKVFVINLRRHGGDILEGLRSVLSERKSYFSEDLKAPAGATTPSAAGCILKRVGMDEDFTNHAAKAIETLLNEDKAAPRALPVLIKGLIKGLGNNVTLIIDEANIAFTIKDKNDRIGIEEALAALRLFIAYTKEKLKVTRLFIYLCLYISFALIIIFPSLFIAECNPRFK